MQLSARALVALILACTVTSLTASTAAIGFAAANGNFQVNSTPTRGSATLFDGSVIETGKAPSQVRLQNGVQVRLATESRAKIFEGRLVLEKGAGQLESSSTFPVESQSLRVFSTQPDSVARVQVADHGKVLVAALKGAVRVTNASGVVVANLTSGLSMSFDTQVGASAPAKMAGCLYQNGNKDFIFDETTKAAHPVTGSGMDALIGKHIQVTGLEDPSTHAIAVTLWKQLQGGQCAKFAKVAKESGVEVAAKTVGVGAAAGAAAGAGAAGAAAGGAAAGAAAGTAAGVATTVAVVGGVAAAASVGGVAAAGGFSGSSPAAPASR